VPDGVVADTRARLHELQLGTDSIAVFLEQVAVLAADTIEADAACGMLVLRKGHPITVASSDERAVSLDEAQFGADEGPCLDAARTGRLIVSEDLTDDERWPAYRPHALEQGLRSILSLPLILGTDATGSIDFYVFEPHQFTAESMVELEDFRIDAERAITLALRYRTLADENAQLRAGLASRRIIEQATGVLMGQNGCTSAQAFEMLRKASQNRNVKLRDLARDIIVNRTGGEPDEDIHWRT